MNPKHRTIKNLLEITADYLKKKQIESPRLTAEVLLAHQLHVNRLTLYLNLDQPLNELEISGYRQLLRRRLQREPLQYITGVQEFWSLDFIVNCHVLIPRPETEHLVEQAIERIRECAASGNHLIRILDLGAGCGAIAVALAKEIQGAQIWATDISQEAINLARLNAEKHHVSNMIEFRKGDLWQPLVDQGGTFDLIVSNPPYIDSEQYENLPPEVRNYEPRRALNGGVGGMYYIQKIIEGSPVFLNPGGWLLLEMAPDQTGKALEIIRSVKVFKKKMRIEDYSRRYRVVCAQKGL